METEQLQKYINGIGPIYIAITLICTLLVVIPSTPFSPINSTLSAYHSYKENKIAKTNMTAAEEAYNAAKAMSETQSARITKVEKEIYKVQGMQIGSEASFAEPFETMLDIARDSKLRFKSINYNYSPAEDPLIKSGITGYNVCEMDIVSVGTYGQIKNFIAGVMAQPYLIRLSDVKLEPWGYDKTILIAKFKLTFYTKP